MALPGEPAGEWRAREALAHGNPVPKFYKSVIDDVIEGVRDIFIEEGVDEPVLKELKRRWESKVLQSKVTEGFFRHSHLSPQFTLHLPVNFRQALQTSTGVAVGKGMRPFNATAAGGTTTKTTTAVTELGTSRAGGPILTLPSGLTCPIQIPAGVTLQTASGHLYKVNMPVVVTQAPGGGSVLQNPVQQMFQPSGKQTAASQSPTATLQAQKMGMEEEDSPSLAMQEATGNGGETATGALVSQQPPESPETPQNGDAQAPISVLKLSESNSTTGATGMTAGRSCLAGELPVNLEQPLDPNDIIELIIMSNELDDSTFLSGEANVPFAEELGSSVQMEHDLQAQKDIANDLEKIIQLDGTDDISPKGRTESPRDGEDEELVGNLDAQDLKVLDDEEEEDGESIPDSRSLSSNSDNDDPSVDVIEEDPLNSGDDVSEQETPDVFDTDNIIVCQYDKVQRSKNRWKFYLKDGVMCFGGKDYVFSKAIGDAEW